MYHPRLYGSFHEMGLKYGTLLRNKANFALPQIAPHQFEFGLKSYEILKSFYPEIIEEIEGFAKGIADKPEHVGAFLLSLIAGDFSGRCSVFAFCNKTETIIGRNYDMPFAFKKLTESSLIAPENRYSYISQSDVFIGRSDGINEKGLSIAMSFVNGTVIQPGVSFHFIIRKVLEECASTAEAVKLIEQAPISSSNNFLIADAAGDLAIVESAPQKSVVVKPQADKPFLYITNQFVTPEMKPLDKGGIDWSKSLARYQELESTLNTIKQMDLETAKTTLANPCVCLNLKKHQFGTIWSVVANLSTLEIERAESKPSTKNYKSETRLNWWLNKRSK